MLPGPRASQQEGQGGSRGLHACWAAARGPGSGWPGHGGQVGQETPRGHARNSTFPPPQGSLAQKTTTSCGPHPMSGATSVCWGTRLFSNGGPPTPRALMEKTLTGQWSCPTAPAPERTMNGWLSIHARDRVLFWSLSSVGNRLGRMPSPEERERLAGNKYLLSSS